MATVLGERFPKGMAPGDRIEWADEAGTVIDRAANGVGDGCELPGYWLWVMADDGAMVRVRTWASGRRKGEVVRDDGPMWQRSATGKAKIVANGHTYPLSFSGRKGPACDCCQEGVSA